MIGMRAGKTAVSMEAIRRAADSIHDVRVEIRVGEVSVQAEGFSPLKAADRLLTVMRDFDIKNGPGAVAIVSGRGIERCDQTENLLSPARVTFLDKSIFDQ